MVCFCSDNTSLGLPWTLYPSPSDVYVRRKGSLHFASDLANITEDVAIRVRPVNLNIEDY